MSQTDLELLASYSRHRAEDAFAEIVRRHLGLVHSAAMRQVGCPQLAEEVAQSVFTTLAREAGRLRPDTILAAWLYQVAHHTAANVVRGEVRRQMREQIASEMNAISATAADWTRIEPLLDEAMQALDETDRAAVLLRYFENQSLREVGQALGASENAVQKRLARAIERLREFITKRGVTVGTSGLAVVISANAVHAAPTGLASTISTAAALSGTVFATATATATNAIVMTTTQKALVAVVLTVAAGTGIFEAHQAASARAELVGLKQQQLLMAGQLDQMTRERDEATRQLAAFADGNERLNRATAELLKLRGEVTRLKNQATLAGQGQPAEPPLDAAATAWLVRARQLKEYVERNPAEQIPEFQFLTEREWRTVADAGLETDRFETKDDFRRAMESLRSQAELRFALHVQSALGDYSAANNGQFPSDLSQLMPYCDPSVGALLQNAYELRPASILPANSFEHLPATVKQPEWIVVRKARVNPNSTSRLALSVNAWAYWQSEPELGGRPESP